MQTHAAWTRRTAEFFVSELVYRNPTITSLRVIPTVAVYYYIFVTNSDILSAKRPEAEDNSDEI